MWISDLTTEDLSEEMIDRILFQGIEDTGESADCIIVLGSIKAVNYRVPVAVRAYREGRAGKILLCGGAIREFPDGQGMEAERMYRKAIELGVPAEDLIPEKLSQNTVENMLAALLMLQRNFWLNRVKGVLLVTAQFHMRRSLAIARYLFPAHIRIIPCPAEDDHTTRDNWKNTAHGRERALQEAKTVMECVQKGVIPDFEI